MFDYRFTRNATEYTAKLQKEAHDARLARGVASPLAKYAAHTFRAWANRIEASNNKGAEGAYSGRILEGPRNETHLVS